MIQVTASIKNGALTPDQEVEYANELSKLEGKTVTVYIVPNEVRTSKQNNYYWGTLIYLIHQDLVAKGWRANDIDTFEYDGNLTKRHVHMYMRYKFLQVDILNEQNAEITRTGIASTSELTTKQFGEYIDSVRQWAIEYLDLNIPDPNETV